jgi:hypothetical protein
MSTPVRASGRDLRTLARIVSEGRPDLPAEGLPPSRQPDVMSQIRCDALSFDRWDPARQVCWFAQELPSGDAAIAYAALDHRRRHPRLPRAGCAGRATGRYGRRLSAMRSAGVTTIVTGSATPSRARYV